MRWPQPDSQHLIVTASQMARLESEILSNGMPVAALMEKVGQKMANWLFKKSELLENGVLILVGPGHNGGDGLVVARELHLKGVKVDIWCPLKINKPLTDKHLAYVRWLGIKELESEPEVSSNSLWVEALFGVGQSRPLPTRIAKLLRNRQISRPGDLISLDIPAGLNSDSGRPLEGGSAIASFTLTVGLIKQGLVQDSALAYVGQIERIDIDLPPFLLEQLPAEQPRRICFADLLSLNWPKPALDATKYMRGRVLIVAGSKCFPGASILALKGVLASGVGSIQAALPERIADHLWQVIPEVVLAGNLQMCEKGFASIGDFFAEIDLERFDAVLLGPGIGLGDELWSLGVKVLEGFSGLLVLDADGINRLAFSSEGWQWLKRRSGPTWITPHLTEFQRLFPELKHLDPLMASFKAAQMSGAGLLLKGAHSVIADPYGALWQLGESAPWSARTGLGDVLAGFVTGVGAIGLSSANVFNSELLAGAALMHSKAAQVSRKGSSAGHIARVLEGLVTTKQSENVYLDTRKGAESQDFLGNV